MNYSYLDCQNSEMDDPRADWEEADWEEYMRNRKAPTRENETERSIQELPDDSSALRADRREM